MTFWVNYHKWWLVLRECLYRHTKVLLDSFFCCWFAVKALIGFAVTDVFVRSLPSSLVVPGANSTAASSLMSFGPIWCVQGPVVSPAESGSVTRSRWIYWFPWGAGAA